MSPGGVLYNHAVAWGVESGGYIYSVVLNSGVVRPVISLKAGLLATGSGTSDDPYLIQTR